MGSKSARCSARSTGSLQAAKSGWEVEWHVSGSDQGRRNDDKGADARQSPDTGRRARLNTWSVVISCLPVFERGADVAVQELQYPDPMRQKWSQQGKFTRQ